MELPIRIEQTNGEHVAYVLASPDWRASHATWDGAVAALKTLLASKIAKRELTTIELPVDGWMAAFGKFRDDPSLLEICEEAYRERDRERDALPKD